MNTTNIPVSQNTLEDEYLEQDSITDFFIEEIARLKKMRNELNKERNIILQTIAVKQERGIVRRGSLEEIELKSIDE